MRNISKLGLMLAAATGLVTTLGPAKADTVSIGWSTSLTGLVTGITSGTGSAGTTSGYALGSTGILTTTSGSAYPNLNLPSLLNSNSINTSSSAAGEVFIWVTDSGISLPVTGTQPFSVSFTSNTPNGNVLPKSTMSAYLDLNNGVFNATPVVGPGSQTLLASQTFTTGGVQTGVGGNNVTLSGNPYSVTAVYDVVFGAGGGSVNDTINVAVPGPIVGAGIPGLLAACGALLALARRRRALAV